MFILFYLLQCFNCNKALQSAIEDKHTSLVNLSGCGNADSCSSCNSVVYLYMSLRRSKDHTCIPCEFLVAVNLLALVPTQKQSLCSVWAFVLVQDNRILF